MTISKLLSLFLLIIIFQKNAFSQQYCYNGTLDSTSCACSCPSAKYDFNGMGCNCDLSKLIDPNMVWSAKKFDAKNGCAGSCQFGTNTQYNWWCGRVWGAQWVVAECGCKCVAPRVKSDGRCVCPGVPKANATQNESCNWNCNAGYQDVGNGCYKQTCVDRCPNSLSYQDRSDCLRDCELQ